MSCGRDIAYVYGYACVATGFDEGSGLHVLHWSDASLAHKIRIRVTGPVPLSSQWYAGSGAMGMPAFPASDTITGIPTDDDEQAEWEWRCVCVRVCSIVLRLACLCIILIDSFIHSSR